MCDFTLDTYRTLLTALQKAGYEFQSFASYLQQPLEGKTVVLRHDVDLLPANSLRTAQLENELGIQGVYYFRAVPESWDEEIIKAISRQGHEVGYHYESLTTCNGNTDQAYADFRHHLAQLRKLVPVSTICMHGSPKSPYDSKDIWQTYSYKESGIIGEPYLDIDFSVVFYLTDTGRRWDGYKVSVRDRIEGQQEEWERSGLVFHSTRDIIRAAETGLLPERIMITVHPQRWHVDREAWLRELVVQKMKNAVKRLLNTPVGRRLYYGTQTKQH